MPALPKKWVWMGSSVVLIGALSLFLFKVVSRSEAPAASS